MSTGFFVSPGNSSVLRLPYSIRFLGVFAFLALVSSITSLAQPALQNAVLNDQGFRERRLARAQAFSDVEGVEVGSFKFGLSASYSLEFNDNVNTTSTDPEGDIIQTPSLSLAISTPITDRSDLSLRFGVGYRAYWHNEDLSRITITPGSAIAYDIQIEDVFITVFDRMSYTEDVTTAPDLANQAQFPRFDNTIGTQLTWIPDRFLVSAGYSYQTSLSTEDQFNYYNKSSHLPFARAGYIFSQGAANAGLEFSVTFTDYEENINQDSSIVSFGPYMDWQLSDAIQAGLRGGFLYTANSLTILPEETFDANSYYFGLNVGHQLTDYISQSININHGTRPSDQQGAAFTEETSVSYGVSWAFIDPASIGLNFNYIHGDQTVAAGVTPSEIYDQFRVGIGLSYALAERLSGSLSYGYVVRDSDLPSRGYTQNRVTLGLSYRFR